MKSSSVLKVQVIVYARAPRIEVLLLRRPADRGSIWQPVTGKVEPEDTDIIAAARRELFEETGILNVGALDDLDCEFRFTKEGAEVREHAVAAEVEAACPVALSGEHVDSAWLPPSAALARLSWDTHREGLRRALAPRRLERS
jgi:8-oxo-dGTP pyrophosphatase MutT (NUDIX family)